MSWFWRTLKLWERTERLGQIVGEKRKWNRVFSLACGWTWTKKDKEMEKELWLVGWSLKGETPWRDRSLISAVSSTFGTPMSLSNMCVCVCVCVCVGSSRRKHEIKALLALHKWKCLWTLQEACSACQSIYSNMLECAHCCRSVKNEGWSCMYV